MPNSDQCTSAGNSKQPLSLRRGRRHSTALLLCRIQLMPRRCALRRQHTHYWQGFWPGSVWWRSERATAMALAAFHAPLCTQQPSRGISATASFLRSEPRSCRQPRVLRYCARRLTALQVELLHRESPRPTWSRGGLMAQQINPFWSRWHASLNTRPCSKECRPWFFSIARILMMSLAGRACEDGQRGVRRWSLTSASFAEPASASTTGITRAHGRHVIARWADFTWRACHSISCDRSTSRPSYQTSRRTGLERHSLVQSGTLEQAAQAKAVQRHVPSDKS